MSRIAKKYSSSRYSHTSLRRSSSHPRGGSMRTTADALACTCIGVADCEGAVTVAIKLGAATFATGLVECQLDYQNSSRRERNGAVERGGLYPEPRRAAAFAAAVALHVLRRSTNLANSSLPLPRDAIQQDSRRGLFFHLIDVAVFDLAH